ncbi:MAG TPA: polymer-forming cytoskeletal protein, partial [Elusimicrobiales bacterium]|nr:polymer-forming cytoskeletal protein [Elusimicrobiales bacterium]
GASVTVKGEVTGDLVAMGGTVDVSGAVKGDVVSLGGPVDVSGRVNGDITSLGGKVSLSKAGEVDGDISALGGAITKSEKAVHKGEIHNFDMRSLSGTLPRVLKVLRYAGEENEAGPWVLGGLIGGLVGAGLVVLLSTLVTGVILLLLAPVFFPKNVTAAAAAISGDIWRAAGIGALLLIGFLPGLLMMVVSVLGIPLVPFAFMLYAAAAILGLSAFSVVLQQRFFEGIKKPCPAGLAARVAAGYAIMAGLLFFGKLIPLVGGILSLIGVMLLAFGTMIGLGAVWMTRMGTREYAPAQQPAAPLPVVQQPAPQQPPPAVQ